MAAISIDHKINSAVAAQQRWLSIYSLLREWDISHSVGFLSRQRDTTVIPNPVTQPFRADQVKANQG